MRRITSFLKDLKAESVEGVITLSLMGLMTLYAILPISLFTYKICHDKIEERKEQKLIQEITQKMSNKGSILDSYTKTYNDFYDSMQGINKLPNIK